MSIIRLWRMFLSVVSGSLQILLFLQVFLLGGSLEEMLPKYFGIGLPLLFASLFHFSSRSSSFLLVAFALAAGAMEDALSALPLMTSGSFFVLSALFFHFVRLPWFVAGCSYSCYQLWLGLWLPDLGGEIFLRLFVALPIGMLTFFALTLLLGSLERRFGINDIG